MKNKLFILVAISFFIIFVGCKKDKTSTSTPTVKTKTEYLTQSAWKITAARYNINATGWIDICTTILTACEKDNLYIYSTNTNYTEDEGAVKCNASDPQIVEQGNWSFLTNETILNIVTAAAGTSAYTILSLDNTTLKLQLIENVLGDIYTYEITWGH